LDNDEPSIAGLLSEDETENQYDNQVFEGDDQMDTGLEHYHTTNV
jgi:hypothetical protein